MNWLKSFKHQHTGAFYIICVVLVCVVLAGICGMHSHNNSDTNSASQSEQTSSTSQTPKPKVFNPKTSKASWKRYESDCEDNLSSAISHATGEAGDPVDNCFSNGSNNESYQELKNIIDKYAKTHHASKNQIYDGLLKITGSPSFLAHQFGNKARFFRKGLFKTADGYGVNTSILYYHETETANKDSKAYLVKKCTVYFSMPKRKYDGGGYQNYPPKINRIKFGVWTRS